MRDDMDIKLAEIEAKVGQKCELRELGDDEVYAPTGVSVGVGMGLASGEVSLRWEDEHGDGHIIVLTARYALAVAAGMAQAAKIALGVEES
jgi:hypothetical protein